MLAGRTRSQLPSVVVLMRRVSLSLLLLAASPLGSAAASWGIGSRISSHRAATSHPSSTFGLPNRVGMVQSSHEMMDCKARTAAQLLEELRGGASSALMDDDDEYDEEEEEEDSDFDEDDDEDFLFDDDNLDDFEMAESEFAEDNTLDRLKDAWFKTPPLTKAYLTASFAATLYGYLFNKNEFPNILVLEWKPVLQRLQIWRLFTSFLNFGPFGLGYAMTAQFVWTYMSTLERLNHDRPFDFWIMIFFGMLSMVVGYPVLKLSPRFLGHNLSTFLVYIWSRYHEGLEVNMFELFNTRAELLPWFFLAQTFLLEGELPLLDFLGIVFGHIYHHCKTVGILRAPDALVTWYKGDSKLATRIRAQYKTISSDFEQV